MKRFWILLPLVFLLGGCAGEETFETLSDDIILPVMASPRQISVQLPEQAAAPVLDSDREQVYLCGNSEIILETLSAGDLNATVRHVSGFDKDSLTLMRTESQGMKRYEFVWTSAGEQGDRLGRAVILDDGNYHYCLSVLRDAEEASQIVWNDVFSSYGLVSY